MLLLASGYIGYGGIILILAGGGRGQPVLSAPRGRSRPGGAGAALREALPDAEPFEVHADDLAAAVAAAGADPGDDALVAAALVAWESLL